MKGFPHVCQQGQSSQSPQGQAAPPSRAMVMQRDGESSRLDQDQKSPSAQSSANNVPATGLTQGEGAEGFLEQLLPRRTWRVHQHSPVLCNEQLLHKAPRKKSLTPQPGGRRCQIYTTGSSRVLFSSCSKCRLGNSRMSGHDSLQTSGTNQGNHRSLTDCYQT